MKEPQFDNTVWFISGNELKNQSSETSNGKGWRMEGLKEIKLSLKENWTANYAPPWLFPYVAFADTNRLHQ
jgi:hypothetical protein